MVTEKEIKKLISHLRNEKSNAIQACDLAELMGLNASPNQEDLRAIIRNAIDNGYLIGSSKNGYWEIGSLSELDEVLDSLEHRARGVCDRRNNLLENWNKNNSQNKSTRNKKNVS